MVPNLVTALTGPINELEQRMLESVPAIERWFRLEWMEHTPTFYCAVDLRNAGYRLTPVDTDLFPEGFNHLTPQMLPLAVQAAMAAIEKICPEAKNLLLVPSRHCESASYLEHLQRLVQIFTHAGLNVRLGSADPGLAAPQVLKAPDGGELVVEPLLRQRTRLGLKDFDPCTILLNDDLRAGVPRALQNLYEQYLLPPLHAGWATRRKSRHFRSYEEVAKKFSKLMGMDPWLINPMVAHCGEVDAGSEQGLECVRAHCETMLAKKRRKFKEYAIAERPFVVVKADVGGLGAGVLTVRDVRELDGERLQRALARPQGLEPGVSEVIIQEGVPTCERIEDATAEPVVCTIDRYVVGGYYRVHDGRGSDESLQSPQARYVPLAFAEGHLLPARAKTGASAPNRFYMYGVIGRLAMLAAAYELEATDPDAEDYA